MKWGRLGCENYKTASWPLMGSGPFCLWRTCPQQVHTGPPEEKNLSSTGTHGSSKRGEPVLNMQVHTGEPVLNTGPPEDIIITRWTPEHQIPQHISNWLINNKLFTVILTKINNQCNPRTCICTIPANKQQTNEKREGKNKKQIKKINKKRKRIFILYKSIIFHFDVLYRITRLVGEGGGGVLAR